jgi:hypothetical protein
MVAVAHALHQSIGGITYAASQTVLAASRASAHPVDMDGYWVERALEQIGEHRRVLDAMEAELRALVPTVAEAA